jgi:hypothetical protein
VEAVQSHISADFDIICGGLGLHRVAVVACLCSSAMPSTT